MTQIAPARGMLWPLITVAVAAALISVVVRLSRTAAAPPSPAPPGEVDEGVVCFGTVDLEHGTASLYPLQPGRVAEVLVGENQEVTRGTVLVALEEGIARSRLAEAEAAVELAQLQLRQARQQPELHRLRVALQQATCDSINSRVADARRVRAHEEQMAKSATITESDRFISDEKIRELEAIERAAIHQLAELEAQDVDVEVERAEFGLKVAESRREQAQLALEECRVRAPRPGTVLRILVGPGDVVGGQPGQPAVLFAADGPQVIRATVEQEFASRVKEGVPALVRDEANLTISWRGRVGRVAGWYNQRRTVLHDPSQLVDVRTLECIIVLEPGQPRLRLGQSVRIFIGRVPVPP